MSLRELTPPTSRSGTELPESAADSIRIARLPRTGAPERRAVAAPSLRFATEASRGVRLNRRTALSLLAAIALVSVLVVVIASSSGADSHRSPAPRLTPAQQRMAAARRARAAAIAKARRDRGTDAELEDTIPALTPSPGP